MTMRWIACGTGHLHIIGPCPECYATEEGLLVGTLATNYKGRVHSVCLDCNTKVDYFADAKEEKLWKLEPVEAKGSAPSDSKSTKDVKFGESDTHVKAGKPGEVDTQAKLKEPLFI